MYRKTILFLIALTLLALIFTGCTQVKAPVQEPASSTVSVSAQTSPATQEIQQNKKVRTIRLAASDSAAYPLCQADTYFSKKVDELSGGALKVECYFDGVLGEETDTVDSVNLGLLEMTRVSCGNMATNVPELAIFNLPFLFNNVDHFWAALDGEVGDIYRQLFEKAGLKLITFYDEGTRYIFNRDVG